MVSLDSRQTPYCIETRKPSPCRPCPFILRWRDLNGVGGVSYLSGIESLSIPFIHLGFGVNRTWAIQAIQTCTDAQVTSLSEYIQGYIGSSRTVQAIYKTISSYRYNQSSQASLTTTHLTNQVIRHGVLAHGATTYKGGPIPERTQVR